MGCGSSSVDDVNNNSSKHKNEHKKAKDQLPELKDEPQEEAIDVPKTEAGYPTAKEPSNRRDDIFKPQKLQSVDNKAREAPQDVSNSFDDLITYLTSGCSSDVEKVRSIFMWMGNQDIAKGDYSKVTDTETPRGYMKLIKECRLSYASFFAVLCRRASIPCVIVDGWAKSAGYTVGEPEEEVKTLQNSWNAVYCGGGWRLVFPLWACTAVAGHSSGAFTKVEAKGQAVRERETAAAGRTIKVLNEYYFLTDPEAFIHVAFPSDSRWQLLSRKWDFAKFADVPYCRKTYFEQQIEVLSKYSCRLETKNGVCNVKLTSKDLKDLSLNYELYYNHEESGKDISDTLQLNNFVFLERTNTTWDFQVRFPEAGVYKLQIVGGRGLFEYELCSFRINCDRAQDNCKPLPFNPGRVGYGPNQDTEAAGVQAITHTTGYVKLSSRKEMHFSFRLTRDVKVMTELLHATIAKEELQQYVKQKQNNRKVEVDVSVPEDGEYALTLHTQDSQHTGFKNVCNYLLTSERKKKTRNYENPIEKRTRANMTSMASDNSIRNIEELEKEIERFHELDMDEKEGELKAAEDALDYKKDKRALKQAIQRRHLNTLEKAIVRGHESRFKDKLTREIGEAEDVRDHMKHLNRIAHDILEMKQPTISELRSYKIPQPIIVDIMKSTFLMLGERKDNIEDWEDLQVLMGKMGKESMIRRVKTFDTVTVQPDTKYRVERTLEKHTEDDVRNASAGAGTFYVWLRNVCKAIDEQQSSETTQATQPQPSEAA